MKNRGTIQQVKMTFNGNTHGLAAAIAFLLIFISGCATPIGTRTVGVKQNHAQINLTAIEERTYSDASAHVLHRFFLEEMFDKDPDKAIEVLHDKACADDRRDLLYTLSELTYLSAGRAPHNVGTAATLRARNLYMSSAVYAYLYLLGERGGEPPQPYDRRFRVACDLYNAALSQVLSLHKDGRGLFADGLQELAVGSLVQDFQSQWFPYSLDRFEAFIPADALSVYGLTVRYRPPGLGAPFIAQEKKSADWPVARTVPGTLFLRVEGDVRDLRQGVRGRVELYSSYEKRHAEVNGTKVPLENDLSAQLAFSLNQPFIWDVGALQFLKGSVVKNGVYPVQPYSPGRIPVVLVHGTFSSPVWWAEMFNTLRSDPVLWEKYQFWFYIYDSSKPVVLSARDLNESLSKVVKSFDPEGNDDALKQLVIVGHSQGGLLTKLMAVETGDAIVRAITKKGLDELDLQPAEREMVERSLVFSPLPFVKRVVFISTPHRGSYRASGWVRRLVQKIITLPVDVLKTTASMLQTGLKMGIPGLGEHEGFGTSLFGMSPNNPGFLALADIPLAPGITGHSIIAIDGDEEPPDGDDGVVKYTSAHVDYVESEFIVRSGHSSQAHPLVIEEVRRILLKHLDTVPH